MNIDREHEYYDGADKLASTCKPCAEAAYRAAQPDTDAAVKAVKAVPREPTPEMLRAAYKIPSNLGVSELRVREWLEEDARQTWRVMWDAAMAKEEKE